MPVPATVPVIVVRAGNGFPLRSAKKIEYERVPPETTAGVKLVPLGGDTNGTAPDMMIRLSTAMPVVVFALQRPLVSRHNTPLKSPSGASYVELLLKS